MGIVVEDAASPKDMRQFMKYPLRLYAGDRAFVPHLLAERKRFFSGRNPLFEFTEVRYLLARDESGAVAGRITAHIDRRHNEFWGEKTGFFGFFESAPRFEVAEGLFGVAEDWLRRKGMSIIRGPFNFSTNQECGFLAEGFDKLPVFMMPYTKPYYLEFMSRLGYWKARDLLAYSYAYTGEIPQYLVRFSEKVARRSNVIVRPIRMDSFEEDVRKTFSIYNKAWAQNWGFVPMTEAQFAYMAQDLRAIIDPSVAIIAEIDGEPVGFCLMLPDFNPLFKRMGGRLFPFGILIFLLGRRRVSAVRVITMGVVPAHRKRGIDILLAYRCFVNGLERGYRWAEFGWVLEENVLLRRALDRMGAVPYKRYRIFEKRL